LQRSCFDAQPPAASTAPSTPAEVSIPAPAGQVQVVTAQPKESYEIVVGGPNSKSSKLAVKDPSAFWKGDRYLVVTIPD
jgi:hypothetical protein